ncbi:hypothetical protein B0J13DRAFT_625044 [Dactylonectria estremocensis]|uniref:Uncharacterized protein n=1 Tax=Dactylonectria estremocensis TaxID=1079267 RepID=A0A9P9IYV8_9HYPO|nr:hypothetical protein B0J13DRAFT_625044 [Dactylonectria estremocensis]
MASSSNRIITPLDARDLARQGLISNRNENGTRQMHKRRLNRSSDEENHNISLNVPLQSAAAINAFVTIPDELISRATLTHVGFSEAKADALWNTWTDWPSSALGPRRETDPDDGGLQMTFIDFITGPFVTSNDTASDNEADWKRVMGQYGLSTEVQHAILDPNFKYLRLSESCAFWAKDTVEMRYNGLKEIQAASHERERALRRAVNRPSQASAAPRQGRQSVSELQRSNAPGISLDSSASARAIAARNAPGQTVLFKVIDQGRIRGLLDDSGALQNIDALLSSPPSDFSGRRDMFNFTPDFKVAQYCAAYAKRRTNAEAVVIVCIAIPNQAIESMAAPKIQRLFWPSPEWKEYVWLCRNHKTAVKPLRKFREATLLIGSISRKPNSAYNLLESWENITEAYVLKTERDGAQRPAVQYVFSGDEDGEEFLTMNITQSIQVFPFTRADFESFIEANEVLFS